MNFLKQITKVELGIGILTILFLVMTNFMMLTITAQKLAIDDQTLDLEADVKQLIVQNKEIELKINELTTYDRIIAQANEAGMGPNQQNIRTVEE
ncbi:MAG: hypothetical protein ACRDAO_04460 [Culicoidibacterales bacterium]